MTEYKNVIAFNQFWLDFGIKKQGHKINYGT